MQLSPTPSASSVSWESVKKTKKSQFGNPSLAGKTPSAHFQQSRSFGEGRKEGRRKEDGELPSIAHVCECMRGSFFFFFFFSYRY